MRTVAELRELLGAEADELTDAEVMALAQAVDVFARQVVSVYRDARRLVTLESLATLTRRA